MKDYSGPQIDPVELSRRRADGEGFFVITQLRRTPGGHFVVEQWHYSDACPGWPEKIWQSEVIANRAAAEFIAAERHANALLHYRDLP